MCFISQWKHLQKQPVRLTIKSKWPSLLFSYSQKTAPVTVSWIVLFTTLEMLRNFSGTSVLIALYNPFYFYKVSSDISTSISDVSNLSLFFLVSLAKSWSVLLIFSENQLWFCGFSLQLLLFYSLFIPHPSAGFGLSSVFFLVKWSESHQ